jgi:hypothetical protein
MDHIKFATQFCWILNVLYSGNGHNNEHAEAATMLSVAERLEARLGQTNAQVLDELWFLHSFT